MKRDEKQSALLRALILAPTQRDGVITCDLLERVGCVCKCCAAIGELVEELKLGVGAIVLTEEVLHAPGTEALLAALNAQPAWSEIPVVMMMRGGVDSPAAARLLKALRNVTLLERPAPMRSVQSAVEAAIRGRARQYVMRDQLEAIRQSQGRATELQQRLEMALTASELGTFHCPMPLGKIEWNDICKAHFWLPPEAVIDFDLFYSILHPDDRERARAAVERCVSEGRTYDIEYRTVSPAGQVRWVRATGRTYLDENGRPVRFDGTTQDITLRKAIEQEREALLQSERAARTEAERANRSKDEFLATVSHELRTPLNAILGWTQLLLRAKTDPGMVEEAVDVIDRNARLQAQLIEDLLDMSRIISGKIRLEQVELEARKVVEAAVQTVRPTAAEKRIEIVMVEEAWKTAAAGAARGPLKVRGDAGRLQQVVWNLLSNAVKFTAEGGRITASLRRLEQGRGTPPLVEIRVTDTGEGMEAEFIPQMFERFRQADNSMARRHGGLGLGLAIVKQLVELHGGTVDAESAGRGHGSTFVVRLPEFMPLPPEVQLGEPDGTALPGSLKREYADLQGLRVLVVDDDADARRLVKRLLTQCRADVMTAASGMEALAMLVALDDPAGGSETAPDVLISDIGMPGMDGYEFIAKVRALGAAGKNLPAAAVTAFSRADDKSRALRAGYQRHVSKPIEPAELIAVVAILGGRRRGAEAEAAQR